MSTWPLVGCGSGRSTDCRAVAGPVRSTICTARIRPSCRGKVDDVGRVTERRRVTRVDGGHIVERPDTLAVEEPLEIRVDGRAMSVTMRTPGHDLDLAL